MSLYDDALTSLKQAMPKKGFFSSLDFSFSHLTVITYLVPLKQLPVTLPPWLEVVTSDEYPEYALVSSVLVKCQGHNIFSWLSFVRNNYRLYVWDNIEKKYGVWLFKMYLSTLWYPFPKMLNHPVGLKKMELDYNRYTVEWTQSSLKRQMDTGFAKVRSTGKMPKWLREGGRVQKQFLLYPESAFFLRRDGRIGEVPIIYEGDDVYEGAVEEARFPWFEFYNLQGLIGDEAHFHSCLYIPEGRFRTVFPKTHGFFREQ